MLSGIAWSSWPPRSMRPSPPVPFPAEPLGQRSGGHEADRNQKHSARGLHPHPGDGGHTYVLPQTHLVGEARPPAEAEPCLLLPPPPEEQAFRKRRLCIKFIPRDSTEAAICDIRILGRSKQAPPQYTFIG